MRRKTLLLLACAAPTLGGCNLAYYTVKNVFNEPYTLADQLLRHHDLKSEGKEAWQEIRIQYPRCMFSHEFREGFLDGFADYLDRGGNAQPPAVPPKKFTRNKYLNQEGHALIKDYFLGFQYGVDVALATKQREVLTVPVLLPDRNPNSPRFNVQRPATGTEPGGEALPTPKRIETTAPPENAHTPTASAPAKQPEAKPVSRPSAPTGSTTINIKGPTKFTRPEDANTVEVPQGDRLPPVRVPVGGVDAETAKQLIPLPAPPAGVPVLPEGLPTPSVLDDLPRVPATPYMTEPKPMSFAPQPAPVIPTVPAGTAKPAPGRSH